MLRITNISKAFGRTVAVDDLSLTVNQRSAVLVACQDRASVGVQRFEERPIGEMGQIDRHSQPLAVREELPAGSRHATLGAGAGGVLICAVVDEIELP